MMFGFPTKAEKEAYKAGIKRGERNFRAAEEIAIDNIARLREEATLMRTERDIARTAISKLHEADNAAFNKLSDEKSKVMRELDTAYKRLVLSDNAADKLRDQIRGLMAERRALVRAVQDLRSMLENSVRSRQDEPVVVQKSERAGNFEVRTTIYGDAARVESDIVSLIRTHVKEIKEILGINIR